MGSKFRYATGMLCSLALLLLTMVASAEQLAPESAWLHGRLTGSGWLASVTGNLQTPRGGGAGTTDRNRPTTEEIGLDGLNGFAIGELQLFLWGKHELHSRVEWADVSGRAVLADELTSQGAFFPAGSSVESQLETIFGRIGYRAHWLPLKWSSGSVAPEVGVGMVDFRYQLESPTATQSVGREYFWLFPYIGFLVQQSVSDHWDLEADIAGMAGINGTTFAAMDLRLLYTFVQRDRFRARAMVGLAGTWLRRKDSQQPEQNDPDLRYGAFSSDPWAGFHFGIRAEY